MKILFSIVFNVRWINQQSGRHQSRNLWNLVWQREDIFASSHTVHQVTSRSRTMNYWPQLYGILGKKKRIRKVGNIKLFHLVEGFFIAWKRGIFMLLGTKEEGHCDLRFQVMPLGNVFYRKQQRPFLIRKRHCMDIKKTSNFSLVISKVR